MVAMPLAVQSYRHRSLPGSSQRLINSFIEQEPREAKFPLFLLSSPGLIRFATLPTGPWRGAHPFQQYCYVVAGAGVYRVDVSGGHVFCGNIANGGPVTMADNGTQITIVAPETQQAWNITGTTLTQITDPDFASASSVAMLDGFAVFSIPNTTRFFISDLLDSSSFDALMFASAEASPDNIVRIVRVGRLLWIFGERTVELWSNTGASDFPFRRVSGEIIERGCAARDSVAVHELTAFWLGDNRRVYRSEGSRAVPIDTPAVAQALSGYISVSDARGFVYEQEGHTFYVLTFPNATAEGGATWVYDLAAGLWHERASEGYGIWRVVGAVPFAGAVVGGDARDGRLYALDPTVYREDGDQIVRTWIGVPQHREGRRLFIDRLVLDMEVGVGLLSGQGEDPKVWVRLSYDGGQTYPDGALWGEVGKRGQYRRQVVWRRLGAADSIVLQFGMSDPVPITIYALYIDAEVGED